MIAKERTESEKLEATDHECEESPNNRRGGYSQ